MKSGIIGVCVVSLALMCSQASSAPLAQDRPTFELEVSVEGSRLNYTRTVYTYYRVFGKNKSELWRITLNDKYLKHWIGPNGRVWVLVGSSGRMFVRGVGATKLWVRDAEANVLASVNIGSALRLIPDDPTANPIDLDVDLEASGFNKSESRRVQFRLAVKERGKFHINEVRSDSESRYLVTWNSVENTTNYLDDLLRKDSSQRPIRPLANEENWEIWSASSSGPGVLTIYESRNQFGHRNVKLVIQQHLLKDLPSYVTMTPVGRVLLFSFTNHDGSREAKLFVYNRYGTPIGEVDFIKLGAFEYPGEAERSLDYTNIHLQKGNYWQTMLKADWGYTSAPPETIRILDYQGFQYIIKMEGLGREGTVLESERLPPENFSMTKEREFDGYNITNEKLWNSTSGVFVFRLRTLENDEGKTRYHQTLLRVDSRVKDYEHEFWSTKSLSMPLDVFVSDSGRTFSLFTIKLRKEPTEDLKDYVVLSVKDYNGSQELGGRHVIDFHHSYFESAQEADLSGMSATYDAVERPIRFEGAIVPRFAEETYVWKLPDGKTWRRRFSRPGA